MYHHCEGSKEELVRDVSRFLLVIARALTYGSSFINFNLPQFYQIVKVDGREQVIPFRTKSIGNMPPANQDHDTPLLQQYFS
ncbi:class I adenylate cyclase [Escherichia coli]